MPIGEEPDGVAFTGLRADCGRFGYLLLFRESGNDTSYSFDIPDILGKRLIKLAGEGEAVSRDGKIYFTSEKPRSFVLLKYE